MVLPAPEIALRTGPAPRSTPPSGSGAATRSWGLPEALGGAAVYTMTAGAAAGIALGSRKGSRRSKGVHTASSAQMALAPATTVWQPELSWDTLHAGLGVFAVCLGAMECVRFIAHQPPSQAEAVLVILLHLALCITRMDTMQKIPYHWQVTFYASLGWNFWAAASLLDVMFPGVPALQGLELAGGLVLIASCLYFYAYQWGRMVRHMQQSRLKPFYPVALTGLMACHGLDVTEFCLAHWFGPMITGGPAWRELNFAMFQDQWWWIADVRLCELLATSLGLFGIIVAASGKLSGMKNAYATIGGTVVLPMAILFVTHWKLAASFHAWGSPYFFR